MMHRLSFEVLYDFDFLDFGSSKGGSIDFAMKRLGGRRGLGIERKRALVTKMRESGYQCVHGDISAIELPPNAVRFVTMNHILEHLPNLEAVLRTMTRAATVASDFLYIRGPWFDADEHLKECGLKLYWSDWHGHPCHLTIADLQGILRELDIERYLFVAVTPIKDSGDPAVHPITSPINQHDYNAAVHPTKPVLSFGIDVYRELACLVRLTSLPDLDHLFKGSKWKVLQASSSVMLSHVTK